MKHGMKKLLALTMALLMIFAVVACARKDVGAPEPETSTSASDPTNNNNEPTPPGGGENPGEDPGENPGEDPGENPPTASDVSIVRNKKARFVVVAADPEYAALASELATMLSQKTDASFSVRENISSKEKAIYIGKSPKSVLVDDPNAMKYQDYAILEVGGNIHLMGYVKEAVQSAVQCFMDAIPDGVRGEKAISMPGEIFKIYSTATYPYENATLLGVSISEYVIVLPKDYSVIDRFVAEDLIKQIGIDTGYMLLYYKDNHSKSQATHQIVVGKADRPYSTTLYEGLATDTYKVKGEGTCLYIAYDNYMLTGDATKTVIEAYRQSSASLDITSTLDTKDYLVNRPDGTSIRVMSNNVTVVADAKSYEKSNGIGWTDRMDILSAMYLKYLPDFICLQEMQYTTLTGKDYEYYETLPVTVDMYGGLQERIGHEYTMLGKTDNMEAIFYRTDLWKLETDAEGKQIIESGTFNPMHQWYWGLFSRVDNPAVKVIVMNVHYAGTSTYVGGKNNGEVINEIYQKLLDTYVGIPIFIMGDFNSKYNDTPGWATTFNSTIKDTTLDSVSRVLRDENGNHTDAWGGSYTETTLNHTMFTHPIDQILFQTDRCDALSYRFINEGLMGISSGHRPIMADIRINDLNIGGGNGMPWGSGTESSN